MSEDKFEIGIKAVVDEESFEYAIQKAKHLRDVQSNWNQAYFFLGMVFGSIIVFVSVVMK